MSDETKRPLTYDHLRSRKKPVTRTVTLILDSEKAERYDNVLKEVESYRRRHESNPDNSVIKRRLAELEGELDSLSDELDEDAVDFKFRSIGRKRFEALVSDHPATPEQVRQAKADGEDPPGWNAETFPQALVAESIVTPELSIEDVMDIFESDDWNHAEILALFYAALEVNQQRRVVDLKKGSGRTQG